jgi:hypothetical protein
MDDGKIKQRLKGARRSMQELVSSQIEELAIERAQAETGRLSPVVESPDNTTVEGNLYSFTYLFINL